MGQEPERDERTPVERQRGVLFLADKPGNRYVLPCRLLDDALGKVEIGFKGGGDARRGTLAQNACRRLRLPQTDRPLHQQSVRRQHHQCFRARKGAAASQFLHRRAGAGHAARMGRGEFGNHFAAVGCDSAENQRHGQDSLTASPERAAL